MMFVTKCPCDECVPLIRGAGITHIYTTDQDRDKDKRDISYLKFSGWNNISKFIVSTERILSSPLRSDGAQFGTFAQICVSFSIDLVFHLPTFSTRLAMSVSGEKVSSLFWQNNQWFVKSHHVRNYSDVGFLRVPSQGLFSSFGALAFNDMRVFLYWIILLIYHVFMW